MIYTNLYQKRKSDHIMSDGAILNKLDLIAKLTFMQTKNNLDNLEKKLIKTKKQMELYRSLDGKRSMEELHKLTGVSVKTMEPLLPEWEKKGLILAFGKGRSKRYLSLENMDI